MTRPELGVTVYDPKGRVAARISTPFPAQSLPRALTEEADDASLGLTQQQQSNTEAAEGGKRKILFVILRMIAQQKFTKLTLNT